MIGKTAKKVKCSKPVCGEPCEHGANTRHTEECTSDPLVQDALRDVSVYDFRPRRSSDYFKAASNKFSGFYPDGEKTIGAYAAESTHYFIPGRREPQASAPVPPHGYPWTLASQDLMWNTGHGAQHHDVFFGESFCQVFKAQNRMGRHVWPENIATPTLSSGKTYYWRVDAIHQDGHTVKGDVWCFHVQGDSPKLQVPWNGQTSIHSCASKKTSTC